MNAMIASVGGRAPPGQNTRWPCEGSRLRGPTVRWLVVVLAPRVRDHGYEPSHHRSVPRAGLRRARPPGPSCEASRPSKRLARAADPLGHGVHRLPLRAVFGLALAHDPDRPLADLDRVRRTPPRLVVRCARHRSILSRVGASGKPGAVHPPVIDPQRPPPVRGNQRLDQSPLPIRQIKPCHSNLPVSPGRLESQRHRLGTEPSAFSGSQRRGRAAFRRPARARR